MTLPEQLLLSDLLRRRVRCDQGLDHGVGVMGWMHPPVHRLLGWVSRPSGFGRRRLVWRLDQLRGLGEQEALVVGEPAETDPEVLERLPTLLDASLLGAGDRPLGSVADAAVELRSGRILHYLISRVDPRLPGGSRWRLHPERILDQQPGQVSTALQELDDLPLARASVRQSLLRRSRRLRDQVGQETSRWREQFQQAGDQFEERLEGWLEDLPWEETEGPAGPLPRESRRHDPDPLDDPLEQDWPEPSVPPRRRSPAATEPPRPAAGGSRPARDPDGARDDDPWI